MVSSAQTEILMVYLIGMGIFCFIIFLYVQYSSMKIWAEGQRRILEIWDKKFEIQKEMDSTQKMIDDVRRDVDELSRR